MLSRRAKTRAVWLQRWSRAWLRPSSLASRSEDAVCDAVRTIAGAVGNDRAKSKLSTVNERFSASKRQHPLTATFIILVALNGVGCAARAPEPTGPPPISLRTGRLLIDVVYPPDGSFITARDSNFIFGSVGDGRARLTINGKAIAVQANGAFLAWLPVPAAPGDTLARYQLTASLGEEEARAVHSVRLPRTRAPLPTDLVAIDAESVTPRGAWWVRPGEAVSLRVRATPGARVRLLLPDGGSLPLTEAAPAQSGSPSNWIFGRIPREGGGTDTSTGIYEGVLLARSALGRGKLIPGLPPVPAVLANVAPVCAPPDTAGAEVTLAAAAAVARTQAGERRRGPAGAMAVDTADAGRNALAGPECAILEVATASDTVWSPLPLDLWVLEAPPVSVELREEPSGVGRDGFIQGRAAPGATTRWLWVDGVRARVTGRRNGAVRLTLDQLTEAWVALDEVVALRGLTLPSRARVATVRLQSEPGHLAVRVSMSHAVAYDVEAAGNRMTLALYGAYSDTDWLRYGPEDPFLRGVRWEQPTSDRYLLHFDLAGHPWGYRVRYRPGALELDIRKPPLIDSARPLAGRLIAVDPGHPPAGATGPTRLYEGDANLAVGIRLKRLLEREGAEVVMTRMDRRPVRLYDRTAHAELLGAELLVSIHNNALPDGVNPFHNHGTSVYYFHPNSLDLARALQRRLLETMGLADLGIGRASLALARPTWMPAALTEGAFMMIPEQESGLRDPAYLEAYANGVLQGLRDFLLSRAP